MLIIKPEVAFKKIVCATLYDTDEKVADPDESVNSREFARAPDPATVHPLLVNADRIIFANGTLFPNASTAATTG